MPWKGGKTSGSWKKGQTGNAGGRPRAILDLINANRVKVFKKLLKIALKEPIELKDKESGEILEIIEPNEAVQIKAIQEFNRMSGDYPAEKSQVDMQVTGLTDEERKIRIAQLLNKAQGAERAGSSISEGSGTDGDQKE